MKIKHLLMGVFATAAIVACTPETVEETPSLEVDKESVSLTAKAGEASFNVTSNQAWTVTADADWLSFDPQSGKASAEAVAVKVTAEENTAEAARTAKITVTAGELTKTVAVTQAAAEAQTPEPEPPVEETKTYILVGEGIGGWDVDKNGIILTLTDGYYVAKSVAVIAQKGMHFTMNNQWEGNIKGKVGLMAPDTIGEVGNNDISLTESGNFDVYLTEALDKFYFMSEGKLPSEATEHQEIAVQWGVCGDIVGNFWGAAADPAMTEDGEWFVAKGVEFNTVNFKVRGNNVWADDTKWGPAEKDQSCALNSAIKVSTCTDYKSVYPDASDNGNVYIATNGTFDIYFSPEKKEIWVMTPGYKPGDSTPEPEPVEETYTVTGTIVNNYWNNAAEVGLMTLEGNYYVVKGLSMELDSVMKPDGDNPADYVKFKICKTGTWDAYGVASDNAEVRYVPNAEIPVVSNGADIFVDGAGTYDVYFDLTNGKVWVMEAGYKPGEKEPLTPEPEPEPEPEPVTTETTIWEGTHNTGSWSGLQELSWGKYDWTTVTAGQKIKVYVTPNDPTSDWWCLSLRSAGTDWPTLAGAMDQYNKPSYSVTVTLTQETIEDLIANNGLVLTGSETTINKVTILPADAENVIWAGEMESNEYSNCTIGTVNDLANNGAAVGDKFRIYVEGGEGWSMMVTDGQWNKWFATASDGSQEGLYGKGFDSYNTDLTNGYVEFEITEDMATRIAGYSWGNLVILQGNAVKFTKISLL